MKSIYRIIYTETCPLPSSNRPFKRSILVMESSITNAMKRFEKYRTKNTIDVEIQQLDEIYD